ncbi:DUF4417 domain-containing protein [Methylomonas sp. TEB]|uniref:DUF4417 domain-containing protein n=1 Tax=Methylomonas sp. TEB TaxID=3398229 RepID=UPI0039F5B488
MSRHQLTFPNVPYFGNLPILQNSIDQYHPTVFSRFASWPHGPFHCFVDDWRLEAIWRNPIKHVDRAALAGVCTAPDFSVFFDYPYHLAMYQIWRSRLVAAFWAAHGVYVVPVLQWTHAEDERLHDYFQGLQWCDVVAVRCPTKGSEIEDDWQRCAEAFLAVHRPELVLHFGCARGSEVWPNCEVVALNPGQRVQKNAVAGRADVPVAHLNKTLK